MSTRSEQRTLALRMTEGRIPVSEALHYAMSLAEALRKLHDAGKAHGAVTPSSVVLTGTTVDLIPSLGPSATVTPYTAPEVLQGQPADARSDVFSFGAIVFEMLTGRRAFDGVSRTELKLALCNAAPPPSGSPAVDRLVNSCVAKSPAVRWQRMQKIIMELKLLTVAARRTDTPAAARGVSDTAFRAEMQQLEARLAVRLANYEKTIAVMQKSAGEAAESLKVQLAGVQAQLAAVQERPAKGPVNVDALMQQIQGRVDETIAAVSEELHAQVRERVESANRQHAAQVQEAVGSLKQAVAAQVQASIAAATGEAPARTKETVDSVNQRMAAAEQNMEEIRKHFATLQANVAGDLHDFEKTLKAQGAAIESARTAMSQTDDLVERVVEALELLQSSMIDQHEAVGVN
jgi:hypothetical protein